MKTLIIRLGAIGDLIFIPPVLKALKEGGDQVGLVCKPHGRAVFYGSGLMDRLHVWSQEDEAEASGKSGGEDIFESIRAIAHKKYGSGYDRILSLDNIIENHYLWPTRRTAVVGRSQNGTWVCQREDHSPWERGERPFRYDNYYEVMLTAAGLGAPSRPEPVWRVLPRERSWAAKFRRKNGLVKRRLAVFQLTGSGPTKAWPYWPHLARALLRAAPDLRIVTLGVQADQLLEWDWADLDPRIVPLASRQTVVGGGYKNSWNRLRREVALIEAADLFVGPDSSTLHCAGGMDTPKVGLMTICHSKNLLTHYRNCVGIQSRAPCSPCGKLTVNCKRGALTGAILCMEMIEPGLVLKASLKALGGRCDDSGKEKEIGWEKKGREKNRSSEGF